MWFSLILGALVLILHGFCWLVLFGDKYMYDDKISIKTFMLENLALLILYVFCISIGYIVRFMF